MSFIWCCVAAELCLASPPSAAGAVGAPAEVDAFTPSVSNASMLPEV